jgi:hypothetical protein
VNSSTLKREGFWILAAVVVRFLMDAFGACQGSPPEMPSFGKILLGSIPIYILTLVQRGMVHAADKWLHVRKA